MSVIDVALPMIERIPAIIDTGWNVYQFCRSVAQASAEKKEFEELFRPLLLCLQTFSDTVRYDALSLRDNEKELLEPFLSRLEGFFVRLNLQFDKIQRSAGSTLDALHWVVWGKRTFDALIQEMQSYKEELKDFMLVLTLRRSKMRQEEERQTSKLLLKAAGTAFEQSGLMLDAVMGDRVGPPLPSDIRKFDVFIQEDDDDNDHLGRVIRRRNDHYILVDRSTADTVIDDSDYRKHAAVLSLADPISMHILRCAGLIEDSRSGRPRLIYDIPYPPHTDQKWTLEMALEARGIPLQTRFRYATEICEAVMFAHAAGLVHKTINPQNIVLLPAAKDTQDLSAFLVGFGRARLRGDFQTSIAQADHYEKEQVYQHPKRLVTNQETGRVSTFGIRHDMYSLGVVMLELGMNKDLSSFAKNDADLRKGTNAFDYHKLLLEKVPEIVEQVGPTYANVVRYCLTIDHHGAENVEGPNFEEHEEEDSSRFHDQVLSKLKKLHI